MKPKFQFAPTAALVHLRASDTELAALIDRVGPFALELTAADSLFEAMLRSIIYQQLHGKAAASIHGRVLAVLEKLGDEELVARLTEVRGIGPWTVHMLLIFYLGRPDVMPTGDFAIRLGFKKLYRKRKDPTPEEIIRHARRWQPYRSVASWYLWRSLDTG